MTLWTADFIGENVFFNLTIVQAIHNNNYNVSNQKYNHRNGDYNRCFHHYVAFSQDRFIKQCFWMPKLEILEVKLYSNLAFSPMYPENEVSVYSV
ncbi:hypothetical protein BLOT_009329 [Blomia tropicalis]|nr:hypothetical protein BLOT_009329 [Blomia tropicalis]